MPRTIALRVTLLPLRAEDGKSGARRQTGAPLRQPARLRAIDDGPDVHRYRPVERKNHNRLLALFCALAATLTRA